jgi:hypothetical protein
MQSGSSHNISAPFLPVMMSRYFDSHCSAENVRLRPHLLQ